MFHIDDPACLSEIPLLFIRYLWAIAEGQIEPKEAVKAYHDDLRQAGIRPLRSLPMDLRVTESRSSLG